MTTQYYLPAEKSEQLLAEIGFNGPDSTLSGLSGAVVAVLEKRTIWKGSLEVFAAEAHGSTEKALVHTSMGLLRKLGLRILMEDSQEWKYIAGQDEMYGPFSLARLQEWKRAEVIQSMMIMNCTTGLWVKFSHLMDICDHMISSGSAPDASQTGIPKEPHISQSGLGSQGIKKQDAAQGATVALEGRLPAVQGSLPAAAAVNMPPSYPVSPVLPQLGTDGRTRHPEVSRTVDGRREAPALPQPVRPSPRPPVVSVSGLPVVEAASVVGHSHSPAPVMPGTPPTTSLPPVLPASPQEPTKPVHLRVPATVEQTTKPSAPPMDLHMTRAVSRTQETWASGPVMPGAVKQANLPTPISVTSQNAATVQPPVPKPAFSSPLPVVRPQASGPPAVAQFFTERPQIARGSADPATVLVPELSKDRHRSAGLVASNETSPIPTVPSLPPPVLEKHFPKPSLNDTSQMMNWGLREEQAKRPTSSTPLLPSVSSQANPAWSLPVPEIQKPLEPVRPLPPFMTSAVLPIPIPVVSQSAPPMQLPQSAAPVPFAMTKPPVPDIPVVGQVTVSGAKPPQVLIPEMPREGNITSGVLPLRELTPYSSMPSLPPVSPAAFQTDLLEVKTEHQSQSISQQAVEEQGTHAAPVQLPFLSLGTAPASIPLPSHAEPSEQAVHPLYSADRSTEPGLPHVPHSTAPGPPSTAKQPSLSSPSPKMSLDLTEAVQLLGFSELPPNAPVPSVQFPCPSSFQTDSPVPLQDCPPDQDSSILQQETNQALLPGGSQASGLPVRGRGRGRGRGRNSLSPARRHRGSSLLPEPVVALRPNARGPPHSRNSGGRNPSSPFRDRHSSHSGAPTRGGRSGRGGGWGDRNYSVGRGTGAGLRTGPYQTSNANRPRASAPVDTTVMKLLNQLFKAPTPTNTAVWSDLLDRSQDCLKEGFSGVMEYSFTAAFGTLWSIAIKIQPPWEAKDLLCLFDHHRKVVFGKYMSRPLQDLVEHFRYFLVEVQKEEPSAENALRVLSLVKDMFQMYNFEPLSDTPALDMGLAVEGATTFQEALAKFRMGQEDSKALFDECVTQIQSWIAYPNQGALPMSGSSGRGGTAGRGRPAGRGYSARLPTTSSNPEGGQIATETAFAAASAPLPPAQSSAAGASSFTPGGEGMIWVRGLVSSIPAAGASSGYDLLKFVKSMVQALVQRVRQAVHSLAGNQNMTHVFYQLVEKVYNIVDALITLQKRKEEGKNIDHHMTKAVLTAMKDFISLVRLDAFRYCKKLQMPDERFIEEFKSKILSGKDESLAQMVSSFTESYKELYGVTQES